MRAKRIGYVVFETCEDFEQALALDAGRDKPAGGVLDWREGRPAHLFTSRTDARAAIRRTEHYRLAFASQHPEAKFCVIVPVEGLRER